MMLIKKADGTKKVKGSVSCSWSIPRRNLQGIQDGLAEKKAKDKMNRVPQCGRRSKIELQP